MKIHGYGPSGKELIVILVIAIITFPIWFPIWCVWRLYKAIKGDNRPL